ncbi:MAG TPA: CHASE2 domain-containing protein [Candidatus Udaeobacter sp.]|nr:CHASE2 domain-containing protein [Candidatus Udaeobacter sp.]
MNAKLFINYRREDTAPYAGRLYDRLTAHFGEDQVFIDIDQIEPGEDFVEAINHKVGACDIAIVAIGPNWLRATDSSGKRRLDDEEDFVRMEIVAALRRKIRVIPVLVGGAQMPQKQDLPKALAPLSRRNAIELTETRFHADVNRLIEAIEKPLAVAEKKAEPSATPVAPLAEPASAGLPESKDLPEASGSAKPAEAKEPASSDSSTARQSKIECGMHWLGRYRLLILASICAFWTGLIFVGYLFPNAPFISAPWRGEQSFEDLLRREGRKTPTPDDFVFLGIDQSTLQLPPLTAEEIAGNRAFELMTARPWPWSREVWALLLDKLFAAGAHLVMFDLLFNPPNEGDAAFHAALDRYRDKVVVAANFDLEYGGVQAVTPNDALIPPPQLQDDRVGYVNMWPDAIDGKTRALTYTVTDRQVAGLPPHLHLQVYESLFARALTKIGRANDVPRDLRGHMIRFMALDAVQPRPLYEVFDPKIWHANYADGAFFKDKIVMVGPSAQVLHDVVDTPMSPNTLGPTLHFQAMAATLGQEFLQPTPPKTGLALVGAAGLIAWSFVAFLRRPLICLGGLVVITGAYLGAARLFYDNSGLLLLTVPVLSALLLSGLFSLGYECALKRVEKLLILLSKDLARVRSAI